MSALAVYFQRLYWRLKSLFGGVNKEESVVPARALRRHVLVIIPHDKSWWAVNAVQHFVATLRDQMGYAQSPTIDIISLKASSEALMSVLATLKNGANCDLIVTVGSWVSQEVRNVLDTLTDPPPHIFCGVIDPVRLGIVDSLQRPGRAVSGVVMVQFDFGLQIEMIKALLPELHAVALVCGAFSGNTGIAALIQTQLDYFVACCAAQQVAVVIIKMVDPEDIERLLASAYDEHQIGLVCVLNDLFVSSNMEAFIAACQKVKVPLCTNELSSVYHGVAIGFGEHGGVYGAHAAALACEVLVHNRPLALAPVIVPPLKASMRYNFDAMIAQGMVVSPVVQHLLDMVSVFFQSR